MNSAKMRHRMLYIAPLHLVSKQLGAPLAKDLQEKYHQSSARVIEGDSVKVLRGEFKGIEGKVTNVSPLKRGIAIEGIKREKLKGGNVDIYIHPSNVMITALNLDDKWRQSRLDGQKPKTAKPKVEEPKETKPKEAPKEKKEEPKEQKPKQKETKPAPKTAKTDKEQKSPKSKKSDK
ncbi:LSU ribosomal protein L26e (L24p) [Candidatus Nitrosotalea sp. TS]|uniref:50S ribosomal protein L24 n=1 Tax=Candidatus Nitrosotalea sp. TS TaxID=2341020 RepID=UPI0015AD02A3|nr:50S ribosomal protein L24 [Candidatus Nitrosotalea sp. TS]NHI02642.1 LSU ribosomal protein L26e (L24p) [Candidatus Nitrosotalea sp. TS]